MKTINERLRQLRQIKGMSQAEFGRVIGLKHGAVSKLEKIGNTVVEQNIQIICEKFQVNRQWLISGIGSMFATAMSKRDALLLWAEQLTTDGNDTFPYKFALALSKLNSAQWMALADIAKTLVQEDLEAKEKSTHKRYLHIRKYTRERMKEDDAKELAHLHALLDEQYAVEKETQSPSSSGNSATIDRYKRYKRA